MSHPATSEAGGPGAPERFLLWGDVRPIARISRTTAWRLQKAGEFPKPVLLSPGRVGWRESDIAAWQATRLSREAQATRPGRRGGGTTAKPPAPKPAAPPPVALIAEPQAQPSPEPKPAPPKGQLAFDF